MTRENLGSIKARFGATGKSFWPMGKILEHCDEAQAAFLSYVRMDVPALIAKVERLIIERDAAVADLREAIAIVCDDACKFCKNSLECAICCTGVEDKWEWRGVQEAVNG